MFKTCIELPEFDFKLTDKLNEKGFPIDSPVVDQFYSQSFLSGENGFPKSDIAMFLTTQSEDLKNQIAARMQEIKQDLPDQNLSNEQLIRLTLDRNIQSAPDFQRFYSQLKDEKLDEYLQKFIEKPVVVPEKEVINFDENKEE